MKKQTIARLILGFWAVVGISVTAYFGVTEGWHTVLWVIILTAVLSSLWAVWNSFECVRDFFEGF